MSDLGTHQGTLAARTAGALRRQVRERDHVGVVSEMPSSCITPSRCSGRTRAPESVQFTMHVPDSPYCSARPARQTSEGRGRAPAHRARRSGCPVCLLASRSPARVPALLLAPADVLQRLTGPPSAHAERRPVTARAFALPLSAALIFARCSSGIGPAACRAATSLRPPAAILARASSEGSRAAARIFSTASGVCCSRGSSGSAAPWSPRCAACGDPLSGHRRYGTCGTAGRSS